MKKMLGLTVASLVLCFMIADPAFAIVRGKPVHALALYGEPKYGPGVVFDYVNPNAPKGGALRLSAPGTFDSLNPFTVKGESAAGLTIFGTNGYFYEGLTASGNNEPFTVYCLICETMEVAEDNSWIEYAIRPEARFHDGTPVTPEDVIFSFETLTTKGLPNFSSYWGDVAKVEKTGPRKVRFTFKTTDNVELALVIGQLPVLNKKFWQGRDFTATILDIPVSTGPYRIESFEPGRSIVYKRDPNYWGKNLTVTKGTHNFDQVRFDYFRDDQVAFEAFKAYQTDFIAENTALRWATGYDQKIIDAGLMAKENVADGTPGDPQGFVMNLRRAKFSDGRVREALGLAFDFDWSNKTLAYGQYAPMTSFFGTSDLAATGLPSGEELQILEKFRGQIPDEVFTTPYTPPRSDGTGGNRENLLKARDLLHAAGWEIRNGVLTNTKSGEVFTVEFLEAQAGIEKWITPYLQNLQRLGIKGNLRLVDTSQYINRLNAFDFDMIVGIPRQSLSPGNEQREYWGSAAADRPGSRNWSGIKSPVIDAIVESLIAAKTRESLVAHTRALDRMLLWNHYIVPELSVLGTRVAYWKDLAHPALSPLQGPDLAAWWSDARMASELESKRGSLGAK